MVRPIETLVVEDDVGDILLILQAIRQEPYSVRVHVAVDGEQAIHILNEEHVKPDLVILDLKLPKLSGPSFLALSRVEAPVVVFTGFPSPHDQQRAIELGASEFIEKPTDLCTYTQEIGRIMRTWGARKADAGSVN
ncbi:MAG TPA: response regulator [Bryobacteraceae bacterium]|nr:response regulator [Bryobacteraceae bacterium]